VIDADAGERWVVVHRDKGEPTVRRYTVPGGWLYQVAHGDTDNWYPPVFVPAPEKYVKRKVDAT
jgi:hypothetical protein